MAHGTGRYLERQRKADIQLGEYAIVFFRENLYYYPTQSDSYEPSNEVQNTIKVEICEINHSDRFGDWLGNPVAEAFIGKDDANLTWWNAKNWKGTPDQFINAFKERYL